MKIFRVILSIIFLIILYYFYTIIRLHQRYIRTRYIPSKLIVDNLETGDLVMTSRTGINKFPLCTLLGIDFVHILMVVKIHDKKYFIHFVRKDYIPNGISVFNNPHIQLIECEDYFNRYQIYQPVYKLHKYVGEKIDNDRLFQIVEKYKYKKFSIRESYKSKNTDYSCCTLFMAKVLSNIGILDKSDVSLCVFPNIFAKKLKVSKYYNLVRNFRV